MSLLSQEGNSKKQASMAVGSEHDTGLEAGGIATNKKFSNKDIWSSGVLEDFMPVNLGAHVSLSRPSLP